GRMRRSGHPSARSSFSGAPRYGRTSFSRDALPGGPLGHNPAMTARKDQSRPSRRRVLQTAGGVFAAAAMPMRANTAVAPQAAQPRANADVTGRLARYMVSARDRAL